MKSNREQTEKPSEDPKPFSSDKQEKIIREAESWHSEAMRTVNDESPRRYKKAIGELNARLDQLSKFELLRLLIDRRATIKLLEAKNEELEHRDSVVEADK
jgi:hypothetical protein